MIEIKVEEDLDSDIIASIIKGVSNRPPLYDLRLPITERSKSIRQTLWNEIQAEINESKGIDEIKRIWQYYRERYIKDISRLKNATSDSKVTTFKYFDLFAFYETHISTKRSNNDCTLGSPQSSLQNTNGTKKSINHILTPSTSSTTEPIKRKRKSGISLIENDFKPNIKLNDDADDLDAYDYFGKLVAVTLRTLKLNLRREARGKILDICDEYEYKNNLLNKSENEDQDIDAIKKKKRILNGKEYEEIYKLLNKMKVIMEKNK